jgi:hypothetical protein
MGGYDSHKVVDSVGSRARERAFEHRRAAEDRRLAASQAGPVPGFVDRFLARWHKRASITIEPAAPSAGQKLTDAVCLLTDGSPGRVVLRRVDGRWVEDCVPI